MGPERKNRTVVKRHADVVRQQAVKSCTPRYWFVSLRIAPPIGVPISRPMEVTAKTMPMRVPKLRTSEVMVAITTGGRDTKPPEKKP